MTYEVTSKVMRPGESHSAYMTHMPAIPGVDARVVFQMVCALETLSARHTAIANKKTMIISHVCVRKHVDVKRRQAATLCPTRDAVVVWKFANDGTHIRTSINVALYYRVFPNNNSPAERRALCLRCSNEYIFRDFVRKNTPCVIRGVSPHVMSTFLIRFNF